MSIYVLKESQILHESDENSCEIKTTFDDKILALAQIYTHL